MVKMNDKTAHNLFDAECNLHNAHQAHIDTWITAASEHLHTAIVAHLEAVATEKLLEEELALRSDIINASQLGLPVGPLEAEYETLHARRLAALQGL